MKVEVKNISKSFHNNGKTVNVLDNISFEVDEGQFVSLLGPSGCGKTTTLTIIAGFQQPDSGEVIVDEHQVHKPGPDRAFVFQSYALFPWMTVRENILFPMQEAKFSKEKQEKRLDYLLKISDLRGNEHLYPKQLSGGMKQRTALVRALASMPKVMLMDEPLGALDIQMRHKLQAEIENIWIQEKPSVIMVTHDVDEVVYLSDRVLVMSTESGKIILDEMIDLPRPRDRTSPEYKELVMKISETLSKIPPRKILEP